LDPSESEDKLDQELLMLQEKVHNLPSQLLDRDLAEVSIEIQFLEDQVKADIEHYSAEELKRAKAKILRFKKRADILKTESDRRNQSTANN
jgi:hypothetical protein